MTVKPFFERFLEPQKTDPAGPLMVTLAAPSDSDAIEGRKPCGSRKPAEHHKPRGEKKPGHGVTLAFPSDSDATDGRLLF